MWDGAHLWDDSANAHADQHPDANRDGKPYGDSDHYAHQWGRDGAADRNRDSHFDGYSHLHPYPGGQSYSDEHPFAYFDGDDTAAQSASVAVAYLRGWVMKLAQSIDAVEDRIVVRADGHEGLPQEGDWLAMDGEALFVLSVDGESVEVVRGYLTIARPHADGESILVVYRPKT